MDKTWKYACACCGMILKLPEKRRPMRCPCSRFTVWLCIDEPAEMRILEEIRKAELETQLKQL